MSLNDWEPELDKKPGCAEILILGTVAILLVIWLAFLMVGAGRDVYGAFLHMIQ
jgi:hypothetical protein